MSLISLVFVYFENSQLFLSVSTIRLDIFEQIATPFVRQNEQNINIREDIFDSQNTHSKLSRFSEFSKIRRNHLEML